MSRSRRTFDKSAIELIEEAAHLLRCAPLGVLACYLAGTLPFVLGFLYFWADMSRSAYAREHCSIAALGLAALFVWMKCWHCVFAAGLRACCSGRALPRWTSGRIGRMIAVQSAAQPSGLFVLPIAFVIAIPFGWFFAFYQNLTACGGEDENVKSAVHKAARLARFWQGQNHVLLLVLSGFGFFVWLNCMVALFQIPFLVKTFLGIETVFSKSGAFALLNTTLLAASLAVTFLCVDPLIKAIYVLRCFYGESISTGEDLKVELKKSAPSASVVALILLLFLSSACLANPEVPAPSPKGEPVQAMPSPPARGGAIAPAELNRAIDEVLAKNEFAWRMPREKAAREPASQKNWFVNLIDSLLDWMREAARTWARLAKRFLDWLSELLPKREASSPHSNNVEWAGALRVLLIILIIAIACVIAVLCLRMWQRRRVAPKIVLAEAVAAKPDLADENVVASQLPEDEWLKLAGELMEQGDLRLALRAFYLASLAHLAQRELIGIARFKSNRDYEQEVRRRARALPELQGAFATNVSLFDRAWYGLHEVTPESLAQFQSNLERIRGC